MAVGMERAGERSHLNYSIYMLDWNRRSGGGVSRKSFFWQPNLCVSAAKRSGRMRTLGYRIIAALSRSTWSI
jgi:hypothetical protein